MIDTVDEPSKPNFKFLWITLSCIVVFTLVVSLVRRPPRATRLIILNDIVTSIRLTGVDTQSVEAQMVADSDRIDTKGLKTRKQVAEKAHQRAIVTGIKWIRQNQTFKSKKAEYEESSPTEWKKLESNLDDLCGELFSDGLKEVARRSSLKELVIARKPSYDSKPFRQLPVSPPVIVRPRRPASVKPKSPTSKTPVTKSSPERTDYSDR